MAGDTDRIEKRTIVRAPRSRVWRALTNSTEFSAWFGVHFDDAFTEGQLILGKITIPKYEHLTMEMLIVRIEPERYFAYRWHPYAINPSIDYSAEPTTLVEFLLEDAEGGTLLTVTESGFDQIPESRRAEAFRMNDGGWAAQTRNVASYLERNVG